MLRPIVLLPLLLGPLAAAGAQDAAQDAAPPAQVEPSDAERALGRSPSELPRIDPGRWEGLLDSESPEHFARFLDESALETLAVAENFYAAGRYPETVHVLLTQLDELPDFPPALIVLGTTYFRLRRYGDTAECFERFLVHAPKEVWRTQALGHAYHSLGRYADAIAHYDRVLAEIPDSTGAVRGRALANLRLGNAEEARAGLERVIELEPDHVEALCELVQLDLEDEELEVALDRAQRAKGVAPHEPRPWYLLSRVQFELGLEEEAAETRKRWREIDGLTQRIRTLQGRLLYTTEPYAIALELVELQRRVGDREGVTRTFDRIVNSIPAGVDRLDVYLYALETFGEVGARDAASSAAASIELEFPDRVEAWRALSRFFAERGDREGQIRAAERALRLGAVNDF